MKVEMTNSKEIVNPKQDIEPDLIDITPDEFKKTFLDEVTDTSARLLGSADCDEIYYTLCRTVRKYIAKRRAKTVREIKSKNSKLVAYLSAEYLLGPQLTNNLLSTGLEYIVRQVFEDLDINYEKIISEEVEPGLGNGGLGRLAACYIDSLSTLSIPAIAYGIRYEYGIFKQIFENGYQVEKPDTWLRNGNVWEFTHPQHDQIISFGGRVLEKKSTTGKTYYSWIPDYSVRAVPTDYLSPGYRTEHVNIIRLWSARSTNELDLGSFNKGFFHEASESQVKAENITKVLYPEDTTEQGKELRLKQQYFFTSASLKDLFRRLYGDEVDPDLSTLPEKVSFQLNDTHPVVAVPELMRILIDVYDLDFDKAWEITSQCFNYTCHTLLPEALEVWDVELFERLLPRHMQLIYQINKRFLNKMSEATNHNILLMADMSVIQEAPFRGVRMANLATIASKKVNGVAELHTELLKSSVLKNFADFFPEKFVNVTNGITPRRFMKVANSSLSDLITETIGHGWVKDTKKLTELKNYIDDSSFLEKLDQVKQDNKLRFKSFLHYGYQMTYNPETLTDVMVKRLHEYKRQTLKLLHIVTIYNDYITGNIKLEDITPRTVIFGAKAAPGYSQAKEIIKLINDVAAKINSTPGLNERLNVLFVPNYNVTASEYIIPASDLSEQISLAGKEASGTGNMKFALNGALTVGTLDGANVEIRNLVGDDNFFLFGMTEPEVHKLSEKGYKPYDYYESNPKLKSSLDLIAKGEFSYKTDTVFSSNAVVLDLLANDRFMVLADYQAYIDIQHRIEKEYANKKSWTKKTLMNIASCGFFSSDRAVKEYIDKIWQAAPIFPDWDT
ncbi:MAG: glycogen/starch/alpha-glucan phosphorylase [Bifidobacteriaceae bacterium]|jgi:starch phosphorylase|nr:glycogen/starch/alpha-glucan phosphorylase [Bifidobacteriaceae bacterium]